MKPTVAVEKFNFHGDDLDLVTTAEGAHFVVLARLCEPFRLDVKTQADKLKALAWAGWGIYPAPSAGGTQDTFCLDIRSVAGWLFTIRAGKIAPPLREKLARYQRECADVLYRHFFAVQAPMPYDPRHLAELVSAVARLGGEVADMRAKLATGGGFISGTVSPMVGNGIKRRLHVMGQRLATCKAAKNVASGRQRQTQHLRAVLGWTGRWNGMPLALEAKAIDELASMERAVDIIVDTLNATRQLPLSLDAKRLQVVR